MFKNMLKRSWLSIKRKLGRTVILTLLFFITGTVFAGALGNSILEDQTASSNEQSEKNFGRPSASTGGMAGMPGMPSGESSSRGSAPNFLGGEMPNMKEAMNAGREEKKS